MQARPRTCSCRLRVPPPTQPPTRRCAYAYGPVTTAAGAPIAACDAYSDASNALAKPTNTMPCLPLERTARWIYMAAAHAISRVTHESTALGVKFTEHFISLRAYALIPARQLG